MSKRFPMHPNPATWFDADGGMPCANIFHREKPGMVVLELRGDFAVDYAREIIAAQIIAEQNVVTDDPVERMCAAHWNVTATTKWDDPGMNPEWKPAYRMKMRAALAVMKS